jgi:hypothetical protein
MLPFLLLSGTLIIALISASLYYFRKVRVSRNHEWEMLLGSLVSINREGLDRVALESIEPSGRRRSDEWSRELEPEQIWELLGGMEGIEKIERNSRVLIQMADFLQRSYLDANAVDVALTLRRQASELAWQVERLRLAVNQGSLEFHVATYAPNVAIAYYLMEQRLRALFQQAGLAPF